MTRYVLVWDRHSDDYYAGKDAALYRDGVLIWNGYSSDEAGPLTRAIVGDDLTEMDGNGLPADKWASVGRFPLALDEVKQLRARAT